MGANLSQVQHGSTWFNRCFVFLLITFFLFVWNNQIIQHDCRVYKNFKTVNLHTLIYPNGTAKTHCVTRKDRRHMLWRHAACLVESFPIKRSIAEWSHHLFAKFRSEGVWCQASKGEVLGTQTQDRIHPWILCGANFRPYARPQTANARIHHLSLHNVAWNVATHCLQPIFQRRNTARMTWHQISWNHHASSNKEKSKE